MLYNCKLRITSCLLVIILISCLLSLPSCRYFEQWGFFSNRSLNKALLWARQDSTRVADSLKRIVIVKNSEQEIKQDSFGNIKPEIRSPETTRNIYHIIVGSFTNVENARLCEREYFRRGYKTDIIEMTIRTGKKVELVSVSTFKNISDAERYLKEFHHKIDSAAWIYSIN